MHAERGDIFPPGQRIGEESLELIAVGMRGCAVTHRGGEPGQITAAVRLGGPVSQRRWIRRAGHDPSRAASVFSTHRTTA